MEVWGGIEGTINRVGDTYHSQMEMSGHAHRLSDLDLIADLGIKTVRYPILWEMVAPQRPDRFEWAWADERLERLRTLGIRPIAGLIHHGSGPVYTSLVDEAFPELFAQYARAFAERYPWVDMYTPVNEPLTTARFSGTYGHWYPHRRDHSSFIQALVNETKATIRAMEEIRAVNAEAQLIQTEDLGKVHSTPRLRYQAALENERRWLSLDLLTGRMTTDHLLREFVMEGLTSPQDADWITEHATVPDLLGFNHYLTSERFLDEEMHHYPEDYHGGNGRDAYADAEAVRVLPLEQIGPARLLREAWDRYHLPLAVTEVHNGCTREEQVRWLQYFWDEANLLKAEGIDVQAITVWALFGSFDWDCLVTECRNHYEPGPFDVRAPLPRPTALAAATKSLTSRQPISHPVVASKGWWAKAERLTYRGLYDERA